MSIARKIVLGTVGILVAGYFILINAVAPAFLEKAIPSIQEVATQYINGKVDIEDLQISNTLELTAKNLSVTDKNGKEILEAPNVVIAINPLGAIRGSSALGAVKNIEINNPVVHITMDDKDKWNVSGLIKPTEEKSTAFKSMVHINNGQLYLNTPYGNYLAGLQGEVDAASNPKYFLDVDLSYQSETLSLKGNLDSDTVGALTFRTESFGLGDFSKLIGHYIPVKNIQGPLKDVKVLWENTGKEVSMSGGGKLDQLSGTVLYGEDKEIDLDLDGKIAFQKMAISTTGLDALVNGEKALIKGKLDFNDMTNPTAYNLAVGFKEFKVEKVVDNSPVEGIVNGEVVLNGTLKHLAITGNLTSPEIIAGGEHLTDVTVPIGMQDAKIIIPGAKASYGGGQIGLTCEYSQETDDILAHLGMDKVNVGTIAGMTTENAIANGELGLEGNLKTGHIKLNTLANVMTIKWRDHLFNSITFDVDMFKDNLIVNNFALFSDQNGAMVAKGKISNRIFDLQSRIANLPIGPFLSLADKEGYGAFSGNFAITGPKEHLRIAGMTALTDGEVLGEKFVDAHGFLALQDNVLEFKNMQINLEQGKHVVDGTINIANTKDPIFNLSVKTDGVRMDPLSNFYDPELLVTGNLTNDMHLEGPLSSLNATGTVHAYDGSFKKFLVDDVVGTYTVVNGNTTLKDFKIKTLTSTIDLEGTVSKNGDLKLDVDAQGVHLKRLPKLSEYADVDGIVDFSGSIKGTTNLPIFAGALTSNSILINGEELAEVACFVESDGGNVNKLNGTFHQVAGGEYQADLLLDLHKQLLQGNINVRGGNIESLMRMGKLEYDIKGALNGDIIINEQGKGTGVQVKGTVVDGSIRGINFKDVNFDVFLNHGRWDIKSLKAEEDAGGFMAAQGIVDTRKRTIDLEVGCNQINAAILTAFMVNPIDFGGKLDIAAQLKGNLDNPEGNASMQITKGQAAGIPFDNMYGMVTLRNDMFKLEQLLVEKDTYKASAYGTFPQDLLRGKADRRNPNAQMDLEVKLDNANLSILPSLTKVIDWAVGDTAGGVKITGTLEDPLINGTVLVDEGTVKFKKVDSLLENLKIELNFTGKNMEIKDVSATVGKEGLIKANGNFSLTEADTAPYLINFEAHEVGINSSFFNGRINGKGEVEQIRNRPQITMQLRFDDVLFDIPTFPEMGDSDSNIGLDISIELGPKVHLYNSYFCDLWMAGGLHIVGSTKYPNVQGSLEATKGTISYLRTPFRIKTATMNFPEPGSFTPHINFEASTKFSRYLITAKMNGPVDMENMENMHIQLTSNPPKSSKELLRMLTLKTDSGSGSEISGGEAQGLLDAGLQMTFLGDVEDFVKNSLSLDEFRIYSGNVRSSIGFDIDAMKMDRLSTDDKTQYNILFSKYITKHILVGYTTSLDREESSLFAEYNLTDKWSLNFSQDEKKTRWYGVQYQTTF